MRIRKVNLGAQLITLLLAAAIGQVEDVAELHERWQVADSVFNDEISQYAQSNCER